MADNSPFGDISTEDIFTEIGRLYIQLVQSSKQLAQTSKSLSEANARNHQLELSINKLKIEGNLTKRPLGGGVANPGAKDNNGQE